MIECEMVMDCDIHTKNKYVVSNNSEIYVTDSKYLRHDIWWNIHKNNKHWSIQKQQNGVLVRKGIKNTNKNTIDTVIDTELYLRLTGMNPPQNENVEDLKLNLNILSRDKEYLSELININTDEILLLKEGLTIKSKEIDELKIRTDNLELEKEETNKNISMMYEMIDMLREENIIFKDSIDTVNNNLELLIANFTTLTNKIESQPPKITSKKTKHIIDNGIDMMNNTKEYIKIKDKY